MNRTVKSCGHLEADSISADVLPELRLELCRLCANRLAKQIISGIMDTEYLAALASSEPNLTRIGGA